jgi:hypothetical protein
MSGAEQMGDPIAVLPTIYHLIWSGRLVVELSTRLDVGEPPQVGEPRLSRQKFCGERSPPRRSRGELRQQY